MAGDIMYYTKVFFYGIAWWLIPIITLFVYRKRLNAYPIEAVIYEKRGENLIHQKDVVGRFENPVNCYKLKNAKDTIPIPQYDWILQNLSKPTNLFEKLTMALSGKVGTITLFKYGSKQYKPIEVKVNGKSKRKFKEVKDKNGQPIWVTIYEPINVKKEMSLLDFEVIDWDDINHMTQEIRAIIQRRAAVKAWIEKYGPTVGLGIVAMLFIIAMYYSYQMIMDAGDRYLSAVQNSVNPSPPQVVDNPNPTPLPLDEYLPQT